MKLEEVKYARPDIAGFENAVKEALHTMQTITDYSEFKEHFLAVNKLSKEFMGAYTIVSVRYSQNTDDKFYEEEQNFFDDFGFRINTFNFRIFWITFFIQADYSILAF